MEPNFIIKSITPEEIDLIKPLWEGLRNHHAKNSKYFENRYSNMSFEQRKKSLLGKLNTGKLKIDVAQNTQSNQPIAYCVSSISFDEPEIVGEIDSLYIMETFRNKGIGSTLMKFALEWFDTEKVNTKKIVVAQGNEEALSFYKKHGFYALHYILQQKDEN